MKNESMKSFPSETRIASNGDGYKVVKKKKPSERQRKDLIRNSARILREVVNKDFGKKCKDFSLGCICCQAHQIVDQVEYIFKFYGTNYEQ